MIKQLSQRSTLMCSSPINYQPPPSFISCKVCSRLRSINCIKCLVQEQPQGPRSINPRWAILVQRWIIPQQCQDVDNYKAKASQGDEVWCHPHRETFYNDICIERFQNIAGEIGVVDTAVFVFLQTGKLVLTNIDHSGGSKWYGNGGEEGYLKVVLDFAVATKILGFNAPPRQNLLGRHFQVVTWAWVCKHMTTDDENISFPTPDCLRDQKLDYGCTMIASCIRKR